MITKFQQADNAIGVRPWPVTVKPGHNGGAMPVLSGRPDASHLIGFTTPGVESVTVFAHEATADNVIGLHPVYSAFGESMFSMFSVEQAVISAS